MMIPLYYFKMFTLWGNILVVYGRRGIQSLHFDYTGKEEVKLKAGGGKERFWPDLSAALQNYFKGKTGIGFSRFSVDLQEYPPFTARVLEHIRQIPYGRVCSYSAAAQALGCSGGSRAVGRALARNRLPVIIPCHRVVNQDGCLGGFSGGLEKKFGLLTLEGVKFNEQGRIEDEVFISR